MVENQFGKKLKSLWSDNRGEDKLDEFVSFCRQRDIRREYTAPYSLEQNRIAERMNRTIQERLVAMLQHSKLSYGFCAEALLMTIHIINMSLSRPLGLQIPQELWIGIKPNNKFRIFESEAYALIPKHDPRKLKLRSRKCSFLCYGPDGEIGYRL